MNVTSAQQARGPALARMAEAMLRVLGGGEVRLLLPGGNTGDVMARQLGSPAGTIEEVAISPVVVRCPSRGDSSKDSKYELLFAASTVLHLAEARGFSAEALLTSGCGLYGAGMHLRIEGVRAEVFAGTPYLYRVTAAA